MLGQGLKVMLLPKERCEVCRQGVDKFLPLRSLMLIEPGQILLETLVSRLAQSPGQAAVNHRVLAVVQTDAGALVDQGLDPVKIGVRPCELAPLKSIVYWLHVKCPTHALKDCGRPQWKVGMAARSKGSNIQLDESDARAML